MSPEIISMYRTPFMIFGVVLVLGTGHCFAKTPEIASLMQISPGRGKSFGRLPFISDIKCDHKVGRPHTNIHLENVSMSQPSDAIPCKLCVENSATVIYTLVQTDGLGSRLTSIIFSLALAWNRSFSFGGFIENTRTLRAEEDAHQKMIHQLLSVLLGFDYYQLRPPLQRLHFGTCVGKAGRTKYAAQNLEYLDQIPRGTKSIFLASSMGVGASAVTPGFVERWRAISGLQKVPATHFKKCGINIAIHVRRGDVTREKWGGGSRWIEDEVHIHVAQTVQAMLPHSCVHVFSSTINHKTTLPAFSPSDFMKYDKVGFHVHLDNPIIDDMAHFAKADVTICTTSTFCLSASMLNPRCVLLSTNQMRFMSQFRTLNDYFVYDISNGTIDLEEQSNLSHCLQTQVLKVKGKTTV